VSQVAANSPAAAGGLLVGDVIVGFGGETVQDARGASESAARQPRRRGGAGHRDSRHVGGGCNRHHQRASKITRIVPLRIYVSGRASGDLDALRQRLMADSNLELVDRVDLAEAVVTLPPARPSEPLLEALTAREHDVLALVADGLSNRDIAAALAISDHTVKFHLASIFGKLGVSTRTEAVQRGLRLGLSRSEPVDEGLFDAYSNAVIAAVDHDRSIGRQSGCGRHGIGIHLCTRWPHPHEQSRCCPCQPDRRDFARRPGFGGGPRR
jgi:DNA-binding CsgD family transcriptional regulator